MVTEQPRVDLDQYRWLFTTAKGESQSALDVGCRRYKLATEAFQQACKLQIFRMTGCVNYISDLAQYLGVCPKDLAKGVQTLKREGEDALKAAAEGQRTQVMQEQFKELEARNWEMEKTLASVGEMLQQHRSWWATTRVMLDGLKQLALPSIFVGGHAFLRGIQNKQTP
jgi:hypothetical protein